MKTSPIKKYGELKPYCEYYVIEEGYDYFLLRNGYYLPKQFSGRRQAEIDEEEEYGGAI